MADLSWRYARASDIDRYYGQRPATTLNAVVIELDGAPEGIIGVSRENGTGLYFSECTDRLKPYLRRMPVLRAIKASMELVKKCPLPVYAATESGEGRRILAKLGFTQLSDETFKWNLQAQR